MGDFERFQYCGSVKGIWSFQGHGVTAPSEWKFRSYAVELVIGHYLSHGQGRIPSRVGSYRIVNTFKWNCPTHNVKSSPTPRHTQCVTHPSRCSPNIKRGKTARPLRFQNANVVIHLVSYKQKFTAKWVDETIENLVEKHRNLSQTSECSYSRAAFLMTLMFSILIPLYSIS